ncbi:hypothetical protein Salat_0880600 [Sesamum alatum]|uniref:Uncharacterized protein n=1 Tax=Sesamum alatum TaxID=300844 RepID=A0AAE1YJ50_9LAMI|nr:hypothetical protein Salat_0880600 [Sesamum alatum]
MCSVCVGDGLYRNKCPTLPPTSSVNANVPASASQGLTTNPPNTSAFTRANEPVMSPTPLSVKELEARMGVGGVTLKSNFKKRGKEYVTLTSLQAVTRSRAQSTQQSSNAM